jgi:predicted SAM-dependent methyltransferase
VEEAREHPAVTAPMRLHVGGEAGKEGWTNFNIQPGPSVDIVGTCTNMAQIADASVAEIYASHVLEHLSYVDELHQALAEFHRVLVPGGRLMASVPDFTLLCRLFLADGLTTQQRFEIMRMIFGGQMDPYDLHKTGLTLEFIDSYLRHAGFASVERVGEFGLFEDASRLKVAGHPVSLNVVAHKAAVAAGFDAGAGVA